MSRLAAILSTFLFVLQIHGQDTTAVKSFFKSRNFGKYFLADHYAPIAKVGLGMMLVENDFDIDPEKRSIVPVAEPVLGAQLPIYHRSTPNYRLAVSIPISFSVWFDFTEKRTSPILNTDYRFGVMELNYSRKVESSLINNIGIRFIPLFHESTHIGDELIIAKINDSIPSSRINVSYETLELAVIINDPYDQKIKNLSVRLGAKFLWDRAKGYYTTDSLEIAPELEILPSERWIEPYLQFQYQDPNGWLTNDRTIFIISSDLNLRVRYGYPSAYFEQGALVTEQRGEAYQLSVNSLIGWKFLNAKKEISGMGLFFKAYFGVNPHGQFRNIPTYPWLGINLIYDL